MVVRRTRQSTRQTRQITNRIDSRLGERGQSNILDSNLGWSWAMGSLARAAELLTDVALRCASATGSAIHAMDTAVLEHYLGYDLQFCWRSGLL